jgi:hypothetical protein
MLSDAVSQFLGLPASGVPSMIAPIAGHHAGQAHEPLASRAGGGTASAGRAGGEG